MGINLTPGATDPQIQTLARHAQTGDKHAQLALGIAFEEGDGVPSDVKRARKLYRLAATPSGGTTWVYVPATRKGGKGSVLPVNLGPKVEGLAEAKGRLDTLQQLSGDRDSPVEFRRLVLAAEVRFEYCKQLYGDQQAALERAGIEVVSPLSKFKHHRLLVRSCLYTSATDIPFELSASSSQKKLVDGIVDEYVSYNICNTSPCLAEIKERLRRYKVYANRNSPASYAIKELSPYPSIRDFDEFDEFANWWLPGRGICNSGRVVPVDLNSYEKFVCTLVTGFDHG